MTPEQKSRFVPAHVTPAPTTCAECLKTPSYCEACWAEVLRQYDEATLPRSEAPSIYDVAPSAFDNGRDDEMARAMEGDAVYNEAPAAGTAAYKAHCIALSKSYTPTNAPITSRSFDSFTPRQHRAMKRALRKAPAAVACLDCAAEYIPGAGDTALICAECVVGRLRALLLVAEDGYIAAVRALPEAQVATVAACWPSAIHYSPLNMWRMLRDVDAVAGF